MNLHRTLLALCLLSVSCTSEKEENVLDTFEIEPGFQIELIVKEPLIADPVDMEIDELGRFFVVEMHGYPLDLSGSGVIKRLEDTDGDGLLDKSTVYCDQLVLPTGILRWKNGFLITDPPNVLYLEDADDDGRAEIMDTILTGFARSNPQHNVNNPVYGLDNWIYLSHEGAVKTKTFEQELGDQGSPVRFPSSPDHHSLPINANGLSVRFKPDSMDLEMLSARCQFGQTFNHSGHHFQTNNANHLYHSVLSPHYIERNPALVISTSQHYLPKTGRSFDLYPITTNPNHQLLTDIGTMTSACGILWYQGGLFPNEFNQVVFTAEPVHNLIHADRISELGATFESMALRNDKEFLASQDSWFRPVNHYVGPDGALYVIDYYRKIIEHPEWLSDQVIQSGELYEGKDQGRIYRITPTGTPAMDFLDRINLKEMASEELIELLRHKNTWWRTHAQRLLMDRNNPDVTKLLEDFVVSDDADVGKLNGIWLLQSKGGIDPEKAKELLFDPSAGVRENVIRMCEQHLTNDPDIVSELLKLVEDESPKVRFQLLLTLGDIDHPRAFDARLKLLLQDIEDPWFHLAALSAKNLNVKALYDQMAIEMLDQMSDGSMMFFRKLSETLARSDDALVMNEFLDGLLNSNGGPWFESVLLEGLAMALLNNQKLSLSEFQINSLISKYLRSDNEAIRSNCLDLLLATGYFENRNNSLVKMARTTLGRGSTPEMSLSEAVRIAGWTDAAEFFPELKASFDVHSTDLRLEVIDALALIKDQRGTDFLASRWSDLLPQERSRGVAVFLKNDSNRRALLDAIAKNKIQPTSLSWPNTVSLLNSSDADIREKARSLLKGNEVSADQVWNEYSTAFKLNGNPQNGTLIYKKNCGICHQYAGEGDMDFGPDLGTVKNRSKDALLLDILQPNKSIADGFELWTVVTGSGKKYQGIRSNETSNSITIRDATGMEETLLRNEITEMTTSEISAMPENLHLQISVQEMADLLTFIKDLP